MKGAQTDAEHGHAERNEETEKHHKAACLWINLVLAQKFLELFRVEICQHFIARYKRGHVGLRRKLFHLLVRLSVSADVYVLEPIAFLAEIILRINAPGTPLATVEFQLHRRAEINESPLHSQLTHPMRHLPVDD
jgi:hypothetical protein